MHALKGDGKGLV